MKLDDLLKLSPTQAMQAAASELSLPDNFFDRMWSQESGRGQKMRSPVGAQGHFGIMPATQHAWETRDKASYNPDDFYQGLYLASQTMRENLSRFSDPIDATRAYNSGWNPKKWNNPETVGYVSALWGDAAPQKATGRPANVSQEDWPALPGRPAKPQPDTSQTQAAAIELGTSTANEAAAAATTTHERFNFQREQDAAAQVQARKDDTGVADVLDTALRDPRVMPTWAVMARFDHDTTATGGYDYMARRDQIEAGRSDDERAYLRENAVSPETEQRALAELNYRRDLDQTYSDAGGVATFAGQMAAGLMDPASLVMGLGVMKGFQVARIGSGALAASGRGGAAALSMMAENATVNVGIEALADAVGETKTSSDYAMAATSGALLAAPFTRGAFRQAHEARVREVAQGIHERAANEQVAAVTDVAAKDPTLTPEQVARTVERQETERVTRAVHEASGPVRQDAVIPESVRREMEAEFTGIPEKTDASATAPEPVKAAKEAPEVLDRNAEADAQRHTQDYLQQIRDESTVTREATDKATGQVIKMSWNPKEPTLKGHGNVGEALAAIAEHQLASPSEKKLATYFSKVMSKDGLDVEVRVAGHEGRSFMDPNGPQVRINDKRASGAGDDIASKIGGLSKYGVYAMLHETAHVATYHRIRAWEKSPDAVSPKQRKVMTQFQDLYERFRQYTGQAENQKALIGSGAGAKYAAQNLHEFAAQLFTDRETRNVLATMPGKPVAGRISDAFHEFVGIVRRILGLESEHNAFDEGSKLLDQLIALPVDNITYRNGKPVFAPPETNGINPADAMSARNTWGQRMTQYATDYMAQHPIDLEKLKVATKWIGGVSDGLRLAGSKNPIMQLVASLVTETTTGAAGRGANVAVRLEMLHRKYVGNAMMDYGNAYSVYRNANGGSVWEDGFRGAKRREFDQKVTEEVLSRKLGSYQPSSDKSVVEAADALQGLFDRARLGQIDAGVLGHANLPGTSKGYLPQSLDGAKLQTASVVDLALLHKALADQFVDRIGFDRKFAEAFAPFYTERVRRRAMGEKNIDGLGAGGDGVQLIRDTLDEMNGDPSMVDRARAAVSEQGAGHTKARLDVDLLAELRPGLRMMDFYVTNPLLLARSYAKRTAGTVSLTEAGIHGIRGIRELRQASLFKQDAQPTLDELAAFDRVMSEVMGTPVAGAVVSSGATNLRLLVGLQRLGGLVFQQASETFQLVHHLGVRSLLNGVPTLPRMLGEVGRLKKGGASHNHILETIDSYGGDLGMESYKMIAPLDAPDNRLGEYMDQPGLMSRLLRAGGHAQAKVSGFRGFMAGQHRMVAEQIVKKAVRFIRDSGSDVALHDMGFTPEVVQSMKGDLQHIATWDSQDQLHTFDLTRVSDARTAEAFVQAVHRGTAQIIQGSFVGERNAWFHNDWMNLMLQLRTFGLTATEKQWGRTRMIHGGGAAGYAYAGGVVLGQMAFALPIYMAKVQLSTMGMSGDARDKYLKDALNPAALVKATMNYASATGSTGDVLDLLTGVAGGWGNQHTKEMLGTKAEATSVRSVLPAVATIDTAVRVASGKSNLRTAIKQLPFSNLWYLAPAVNLTKHD